MQIRVLCAASWGGTGQSRGTPAARTPVVGRRVRTCLMAARAWRPSAARYPAAVAIPRDLRRRQGLPGDLQAPGRRAGWDRRACPYCLDICEACSAVLRARRRDAGGDNRRLICAFCARAAACRPGTLVAGFAVGQRWQCGPLAFYVRDLLGHLAVLDGEDVDAAHVAVAPVIAPALHHVVARGE
jgi:hypothetical protein